MSQPGSAGSGPEETGREAIPDAIVSTIRL